MSSRPSREPEIHFAFDEEEALWYVAQSDIPGLHLEGPDPLELVRRVAVAAGELMELNGPPPGWEGDDPSFTPVFDHAVRLMAYA